MLKSLGLIETIGLTTGITAADAAVKSANVTLVGYEMAKGSGRTVIKVEGDVGAVKAAVDAACAAALRVGQIAGAKVIARPSESLESMIRNKDTVGYNAKELIEQKPEKESGFVSEMIKEQEKELEENLEKKFIPEVSIEGITIPEKPEPAHEVAETDLVNEAAEPEVQEIQEEKPEQKPEENQEEQPKSLPKKNTKKGSKTKR